ncbi:LpqB family beta-propeller domain-containing protein [Actinoplanes sp. HUAS TT8]|uniref:LpqB family beta-propeller domain-containing protein n=1 Tax=Actinoplanes sp. HUAS TT8 TaxID=3447453 RepID=UPI003F51EEF0
MHRRRTAPIALPTVVALVALLSGACGIPDESGVTVVGAGPSAGTSSGDERNPGQISRDAAADRKTFAENYLKVAAGDLDSAADRMRTFMTKSAAASFDPKGTDLTVIRLTADPLVEPGSDLVTLNYEQVGTLDKFGLLEPATEARRGTYQMRIGTDAGQSGYFVTEPPPGLLLSAEALTAYYEEHTIYFWNTDYTGLVPDVRYMPDAVPVEQRPTTVMTWLLNGPAPWLSVSDLPDSTTLVGKVVEVSDNKLQITLSTQALPSNDTAQALTRLRQQLQWSLRPMLSTNTQLVLKVGRQDVGTFSGEDYESSNPAYRLVSDPERFVVFDGKIHRITGSANTFAPVPVLVTEENKDVRLAAMSASTSFTFAAVVSRNGKNDVLRVAAAGAGAQAALQPISGLTGTLGTPVWAITDPGTADGAVGLITADGKLFSFGPKKGRAVPILWSGPGAVISSVAVAPDGHRVVLVVDGKLYRAALTTSGDTPTLGTPQQIRPYGLSSVTAAGFTAEGWLTVAGQQASDKRTTMVDLSIDGAVQSGRLDSLGDKPVDSIAAYPSNPLVSRAPFRSVSYSWGGKAWEALSVAQAIGVDKVSGLIGDAPPDAVPTAPFYLE